MNKVDRIYYALREISDKSVVTFAYSDWIRLVRSDGQLTELEELPPGINNKILDASNIVAVASGIVVSEPGMDILRYDVKDAPYVINLDHYTIFENLHLQDCYSDVLETAGVVDSPELKYELQNNVYVLKEPPNDNHWLKDFPKHILEAKKKHRDS